jgi:hypothetical protein
MAQDLSKIVPVPPKPRPKRRPVDENAGTWKDPSQYDPAYLSQVGGKAIVDVYEGLAQLPPTMYRTLRGFMERQRQKSPQELRGTADPYDTSVYDAAVAALEGAAREPVATAWNAAEQLAEYGKEAVSGPAGMTKFLAENLTPVPRLPKVEPRQVVRPKGEGVVLDYPDAPLVPMSNKGGPSESYGDTRYPKGYVNRTIEEGQQYLRGRVGRGSLSEEQAAAIEEFLKTKVRNYFTNQFGTKDDPIFKAIKEGRLVTSKLQEPGMIRPYMTAAAREGKTRVNPATGETTFYPSPSAQAALEDLNLIYDKMTGLRGMVLTQEPIGSSRYEVLPDASVETGAAQRLGEKTTEALLAERNRPAEINPSVALLGYKHPDFTKGRPPKERILPAVHPLEGRKMGSPASEDLKALLIAQGIMPEQFPKSLRVAIEKGQPIYDMEPYGALSEILKVKSLVDHLGTLSPREIKNLRYEDAIKGSVKTREQLDARKALLSRIRDNKPVDGKPFEAGVGKPLISYGEGSPSPGYAWRQIIDPEATELEGAYIGHSVGGYSKEGTYSAEAKRGFREGTTRIYSLRDERGLPLTTVEVKDTGGAGPIVTQVKGAGRKTGNSVMTPYDQQVVDLFRTLNVAGVTEYDSHLPPLALEFKNRNKEATRVQIRGRLGPAQPVGGNAPEAPQAPPLPRNEVNLMLDELDRQYEAGEVPYARYFRMRRMLLDQGAVE